jgi:hypothetical protein
MLQNISKYTYRFENLLYQEKTEADSAIPTDITDYIDKIDQDEDDEEVFQIIQMLRKK